MALEAQASPPPPPQWVIDLNSPPRPKPKNTSNIPNPPGYTEASSGKVCFELPLQRSSVRLKRALAIYYLL